MADLGQALLALLQGFGKGAVDAKKLEADLQAIKAEADLKNASTKQKLAEMNLAEENAKEIPAGSPLGRAGLSALGYTDGDPSLSPGTYGPARSPEMLANVPSGLTRANAMDLQKAEMGRLGKVEVAEIGSQTKKDVAKEAGKIRLQLSKESTERIQKMKEKIMSPEEIIKESNEIADREVNAVDKTYNTAERKAYRQEAFQVAKGMFEEAAASRIKGGGILTEAAKKVKAATYIAKRVSEGIPQPQAEAEARQFGLK